MIKKFLLFVAFASIFYSNANAYSVSHKFTAFVGPFNAAKADFSYRLSPKNYAVDAVIRTNGTFDVLYPFEAQYATDGEFNKGIMETKNYHYKSKSRFNKRSKKMIYDDNGQPIFSISSKNGKEKKKNILVTADNKNTTNLQSVLAALAKHYNENRTCNFKVRVFDGKKRFDVIFKDEGKDNIEKNDYSDFEGQAFKCSMYIDKLGAKGDDLLWQMTSDKPVYFWLLDDAKTKIAFIARIKIDETPLGEMNVYTTDVEVKK